MRRTPNNRYSNNDIYKQGVDRIIYYRGSAMAISEFNNEGWEQRGYNP